MGRPAERTRLDAEEAGGSFAALVEGEGEGARPQTQHDPGSFAVRLVQGCDGCGEQAMRVDRAVVECLAGHAHLGGPDQVDELRRVRDELGGPASAAEYPHELVVNLLHSGGVHRMVRSFPSM